MTYSPLTYSLQRRIFDSMHIQEKVGKRVKSLRINAGISQMELASLAGLDRTYITSVENGRRNISIVSLEKIVCALNLTLKDFFYDTTFSEKPLQ